MYYIVRSEGVKMRGKFYSVMQRDMIVCQTFSLDEVKRYIENLGVAEKILPRVIFGDDDEPECTICMDAKKDTVFSPCGHFVTCGGCAGNFDKCPMCRTKVTCVLRRDEIGE